MQSAEFNAFIEEKLNDIRDLLVRKGDEYVPAGVQEKSRFHNFEVSSALNGTTKEQALWGFVTKHIVSLADMVKGEALDYDMPKWDEKIGDVSVYMLLLHAMVADAHGKADMVKEAMNAYQDHVASLNHLVEDPPVDDIPPASAGASFHKDAYGVVQAIDEAEQKSDEPQTRSRVRQRYLDNQHKVMDIALHTEPVNKHTSAELVPNTHIATLDEPHPPEDKKSPFPLKGEPTTKPVESDLQPNGEPKIGEEDTTNKSTTIDMRGKSPQSTAEATLKELRQQDEKPRIEKIEEPSTEDVTSEVAYPEDQKVVREDTKNKTGKIENLTMEHPLVAGQSMTREAIERQAWLNQVTPPGQRLGQHF